MSIENNTPRAHGEVRKDETIEARQERQGKGKTKKELAERAAGNALLEGELDLDTAVEETKRKPLGNLEKYKDLTFFTANCAQGFSEAVGNEVRDREYDQNFRFNDLFDDIEEKLDAGKPIDVILIDPSRPPLSDYDSDVGVRRAGQFSEKFSLLSQNEKYKDLLAETKIVVIGDPETQSRSGLTLESTARRGTDHVIGFIKESTAYFERKEPQQLADELARLLDKWQGPLAERVADSKAAEDGKHRDRVERERRIDAQKKMESQEREAIRQEIATARAKGQESTSLAEALLSRAQEDLETAREQAISSSSELKELSDTIRNHRKEEKILDEKIENASQRGQARIYIGDRHVARTVHGRIGARTDLKVVQEYVSQDEAKKMSADLRMKIIGLQSKLEASIPLDVQRNEVSQARKSLQDAKKDAETTISAAEVKWQYRVFEDKGKLDGYTEIAMRRLFDDTRVSPQQKLYFLKKANTERDTWNLSQMHKFSREVGNAIDSARSSPAA